MTKLITETKATCSACGNVWYFGMLDELDDVSADLIQAGKGLLCCSGCFPALLIPEKGKQLDTSKCPKCNSRAITKEKVTHEVP